MAGPIVPDCGGAWVPDTGGGGKGQPPAGVTDILEKFGQNGVVISGVVTWIGAQVDTQTSDAWKSLAERCFLPEEISSAKEALRGAKGTILETLVVDFKTNRSGAGKKVKELMTLRKLWWL